MSRLGSMILILSLIPAVCLSQVAYHGSSIYFYGALAIDAPYTWPANKIVTFEAWVCMTASPGRMSTFNRQSGGIPNTGYHLQIDTTGVNFWGRDAEFIGSSFSITSTVKPMLNTWVHIVGVHGAAKAYLYVNGAVQDSAARVDIQVSYGQKIGYSCVTTPQAFVGYMSHLRFYWRELSAAEIAWNYAHPALPFSTDSLKMWYKLNEYTGGSVTDYSGNGCTGTVQSGVICLSPTVNTSSWRIDTPEVGAK